MNSVLAWSFDVLAWYRQRRMGYKMLHKTIFIPFEVFFYFFYFFFAKWVNSSDSRVLWANKIWVFCIFLISDINAIKNK